MLNWKLHLLFTGEDSREDLILLHSSHVDNIMAKDGMCMFTRAVWMCSCSCEQMHVVSVVVMTGHQEMHPVCSMFPAFIYTSPHLCSAFPSFQGSPVKQAVTWPFHAGGLPHRIWHGLIGVLCKLFLILLIDSIVDVTVYLSAASTA